MTTIGESYKGAIRKHEEWFVFFLSKGGTDLGGGNVGVEGEKKFGKGKPWGGRGEKTGTGYFTHPRSGEKGGAEGLVGKNGMKLWAYVRKGTRRLPRRFNRHSPSEVQ